MFQLAGASAGADEAAIEVLRADGTQVRLTLEPGTSALIVHFWASWCPECTRELPDLERAAERCPSAVRFALVNVGESLAAAERFRSDHGLRLPLLRDPEGREWRRFARGLPANVIWTQEGQRAEAGPHDRSQWEDRLARLGCEAENAS